MTAVFKTNREDQELSKEMCCLTITPACQMISSEEKNYQIDCLGNIAEDALLIANNYIIYIRKHWELPPTE